MRGIRSRWEGVWSGGECLLQGGLVRGCLLLGACSGGRGSGPGGAYSGGAGACSQEGGLQALTQGGSGGGSGPGPHPRGKLRGIRSRPTPKGEIEGDQVQAHTQGEIEGARSRPTLKGEIEGDQVQVHTQGGKLRGIRSNPPPPPDGLLLRSVRILLECILVDYAFSSNRWHCHFANRFRHGQLITTQLHSLLLLLYVTCVGYDFCVRKNRRLLDQ